MRATGLSVGLSLVLLAALPGLAQSKKAPPKLRESPALVVVNGQKITDAELQRLMQTRQVSPESREKYRRAFLEELVDARLIRQFLAEQNITASPEEVDQQVRQIQHLAAQSGTDPQKAMLEAGYTPESLREEFALPLAWKRYIDRESTAARMQKEFEAHREHFDGTKVRARQILFKVASKEERDFQVAEKRAARLRAQIENEELTFEEAARKYSDAPSKEQGGDVGLFPYRGKMPPSFSNVAFELKVGEISQPFRSTFGVHLCLVTERQPGELSLEDVRDEVLVRVSQDIWKETVAELRKTAKIEWKEGR